MNREAVLPDPGIYNWQPANSAPGASFGVPPPGVWQGNPSFHQPYVPTPQFSTRQKLKQGLAITSLSLGGLGLVICVVGVLTAVPGLVCGILALKKANRLPEEYGGKGLATAGIILNSLVLMLFLAVAAAVLPKVLKSRDAASQANEESAIIAMKSLMTAEAVYQATAGKGAKFATLEELEREGLLEESAEPGGYRFNVKVVNCPEALASGTTCDPRFEIVATPLGFGPFVTGKRSFYVDQTYVIRGSEDQATPQSPPVYSPPPR
jgi:hypothetical protein